MVNAYYKLMGKVEIIQGKLSSKCPPLPTGKNLDKLGYLIILVWCTYWALLPIVALEGTFVDILENIVWGSHFQFGYDRNPYLGGWIGYAGFKISGGGIWINYVMSQIFVGVGLLTIWKLAKRFLAPEEALFSMVFLLGLNFYGIKAAELCDDIMELGIWPLVVFFFYRALKDSHKLSDWILTGLFAGVAFMIKYYALVLFTSMFLVMLITEEGRAGFKRAGFYVALVIFAAISLPNIIWLFNNDMVAVNYALARAELKGATETDALLNHLYHPWRSFSRVLGVLILPAVIFGILFFVRRKGKIAAQRDRLNRRFLFFLCCGPYGFTLIFSFLTGASINYSWVLPCFAGGGIFFFYFYRPWVNAFNFRAALALIGVIGVIFGIVFVVRSTYIQGYRQEDGCHAENFPGREIGKIVCEDWRKTTGTPLRYVMASRTEGCNMAVFAPDRPEVYFSANPQFSNWIDETDLRKHGAAVVWEADDGRNRYWIPALKKRNFIIQGRRKIKVPRAVPGWFSKLMGKPPREFEITYGFILPAGDEAALQNP